jgi:hypothetical protein
MAAPHVAGVAALWSQSLGTSGKPHRVKTLVDRVRGSGELDGIDDRGYPDDVGTGLVKAPKQPASRTTSR